MAIISSLFHSVHLMSFFPCPEDQLLFLYFASSLSSPQCSADQLSLNTISDDLTQSLASKSTLAGQPSCNSRHPHFRKGLFRTNTSYDRTVDCSCCCTSFLHFEWIKSLLLAFIAPISFQLQFFLEIYWVLMGGITWWLPRSLSANVLVEWIGL